ncbi:MAG: hypothetical protein V4557_10590 [Bacteroidota bacterium]
MVIENPVLESVGTQFIRLTFPFTAEAWEEAVAKGHFNFSEELFEEVLPSGPYHEIIISIIGPAKVYNDQVKAEQKLVLNPTEWIIASCKINGVVYPTFFNSLDWNDPSADLTDAILGFTSRKAAGIYAGELVSAPALESLLKKMITGIQNGASTEPSAVAETTAELMKNFIGPGKGTSISIQEQVEEYLKSQEIPIDFSESSFYFDVDHENKGWSVEITLVPEDNVLVAYSSIPLSEGKNGIHALLEALNELNLTIGYGNYEYSQFLQRLYFKNTLPIISNRVIPELMNDLMEHNFKQMAGMLAVIDRIAPQ